MGYDRELYAQLEAQYAEQRRANLAGLEARQREVFARVPELAEVDAALKSLGLKISRLILSGPSDAGRSVERLRAEQKQLRMKRKMLLLENGYPEDALALRYHCEQCRDTGVVGTKPCECYRRALIRLAYQSSNLSDMLSEQCFDKFDASLYSKQPQAGYAISPYQSIMEIYDTCRAFVAQFGKPGNSLLFTGRPGVGKTFMSTCVARELLTAGYSVIYETAYKIFSLLDDYKFKRAGDPELLRLQIDKLYECDLLILDDLGAEFKTSYTSAALFDVINTRMVAGRKCIVSTNLSLQELSQAYSERVVSRIIGNYTVLQFLGDDIRQRQVRL